MNAQEFVNENEKVMVWMAGNGCPGGRSIAYIGGETELPFDLEEVEGEVEDGQFVATNLNDGSGINGWQFSDERGNLIYALRLYTDESVWDRQVIDYATSSGENTESCREYAESLGVDPEVFDRVVCG